MYYLDECGVDHRLYREHGRAPRGERIYEAVAGKRRERTSVIAASQNGRLVAPLTFEGTCTTEVVDAYARSIKLALPEIVPAARRTIISQMPPAQPHRQFPLPFHRRFLRRFLTHPLTDAPEIKWLLQSKFESNVSPKYAPFHFRLCQCDAFGAI
ncbi:MAG: transposase [Limisphaerales bacterium]